MLAEGSGVVEVFANANTIVGLLITLFGLMTGGIVWIDKRQVRVADGVMRKASGRADELSKQVSKISGELQDVKGEVRNLKLRSDATDKRIHGVEKSMETVARQSDLGVLQREVAHMNGSITAEIKSMSGMMHSFRESVFRAAEKGIGK